MLFSNRGNSVSNIYLPSQFILNLNQLLILNLIPCRGKEPLNRLHTEEISLMSLSLCGHLGLIDTNMHSGGPLCCWDKSTVSWREAHYSPNKSPSSLHTHAPLHAPVVDLPLSPSRNWGGVRGGGWGAGPARKPIRPSWKLLPEGSRKTQRRRQAKTESWTNRASVTRTHTHKHTHTHHRAANNSTKADITWCITLRLDNVLSLLARAQVICVHQGSHTLIHKHTHTHFNTLTSIYLQYFAIGSHFLSPIPLT